MQQILISKKDMKSTRTAASKTVLEMADFFTKLGYRVTVISETIDKQTVAGVKGVPVKTFRWPVSGYFRRKFYQYQVDRWIRKNKPDIVIGQGDILHQDVLFMHNCVHLAHEQIYGSPLPKNNETGRIHEEILTKGTYKLLVCNSELMKDDFTKRFDTPPEKTEIIYPAVNIDSFKASEKQMRRLRKAYREQHHIGDEEAAAGLITSGDFKKRNVDGLIRAFAAVAAKYPQAKLVIAGKDNSAPYLSLARELGAEDRILFVPAISDVKRYYAMIDIFILPAHIEEFGRTVLEAIYCRLPVIVSKYVGGASVLEGEARKYILQDLSVETIAKAMEELFADPKLRQRLAEANIFDADKYGDNAVYNRLYRAMHARDII